MDRFGQRPGFGTSLAALFSLGLVAVASVALAGPGGRDRGPAGWVGKWAVQVSCPGVGRCLERCRPAGVSARIKTLPGRVPVFLAYNHRTTAGMTIVQVVERPRPDVRLQRLDAFAGPFDTRSAAEAWARRHQKENLIFLVYPIKKFIGRIEPESRRVGPVVTITATLTEVSYGNASGMFTLTTATGKKVEVFVDLCRRRVVPRADQQGRKITLTVRHVQLRRAGRIVADHHEFIRMNGLGPRP